MWNTSNVEHMLGMFNKSRFNGDISIWDTSNVTKMSSMFNDSQFNGDISMWDTSNVTNMHSMFKKNTSFNIEYIKNWFIPHDFIDNLF
jgi:surface protein